MAINTPAPLIQAHEPGNYVFRVRRPRNWWGVRYEKNSNLVVPSTDAEQLRRAFAMTTSGSFLFIQRLPLDESAATSPSLTPTLSEGLPTPTVGVVEEASSAVDTRTPQEKRRDTMAKNKAKKEAALEAARAKVEPETVSQAIVEAVDETVPVEAVPEDV